MSTFTPEVKSGILMRDGHQCLMSGAPGCRGRADHDPNHRLNRGMGGSTGVGINDPSNGCAICGACNIGIESIPELAEEARRRGVKLEQGADPTRVPLWHPFYHQWVVLTPMGLLLTGIGDPTLDARRANEWLTDGTFTEEMNAPGTSPGRSAQAPDSLTGEEAGS